MKINKIAVLAVASLFVASFASAQSLVPDTGVSNAVRDSLYKKLDEKLKEKDLKKAEELQVKDVSLGELEKLAKKIVEEEQKNIELTKNIMESDAKYHQNPYPETEGNFKIGKSEMVIILASEIINIASPDEAESKNSNNILVKRVFKDLLDEVDSIRSKNFVLPSNTKENGYIEVGKAFSRYITSKIELKYIDECVEFNTKLKEVLNKLENNGYKGEVNLFGAVRIHFDAEKFDDAKLKALKNINKNGEYMKRIDK